MTYTGRMPPHAPSSTWRSPTTWMLVAALALSFLAIRPMLWELAAGLMFGFLSERPIAWVLRRLKRQGRTRWQWAVAVGFATLVSLLLLVPAVIAAWVALRELGVLVATADLDAIGRKLNAVTAWTRQRLGSTGSTLPMAELGARGRTLVGSAGAWVAQMTGRGLAATPGALFSGFVVLTGWVTFAVEGRALREKVLTHLIPWPRQREILRRTTADVIDSVVLANVGVSGVQAAIIAVATLALSVPHAIVWGVASFLLSFVPLVGTALVTVTAAIFLFLSGRTGAAVVMGVVAVVAGSIDNVLRPMLARGSMQLPFLWVMVAFVGGLTVFGVPGVILGPLFLSWTVALWEAREEERAAPSPAAKAVPGAASDVPPSPR